MKSLALGLIIAIFCCQDRMKKPFQSRIEKFSQFECPSEVSPFESDLFQNNVYRGSFGPEGETFYFFKKVNPKQEDYRIFTSIKQDGKWSEPLKVDLGGEFSDLYPSISKDGKRIVFSSYRPVPSEYRSDSSDNAHLWYADRNENAWGKPVFMEQTNKVGYYHSWVEFGWNNNIYFRQVLPDWSSRKTLYAHWDGEQYSKPKLLKEVEQWMNWSKDVRVVGGSPGPTQDLVFLDVATYNPETKKRGSDIWISVKNDGIWNTPQPLNSEVNKEGYDVFPFFSPDKSCLYFNRNFNKFYRVSLDKVISQK